MFAIGAFDVDVDVGAYVIDEFWGRFMGYLPCLIGQEEEQLVQLLPNISAVFVKQDLAG